MATTSRHARFKVGDWVTFPFGVTNVFAQIIEDRGLIGTRSRQYYRIRIPESGSAEPDMFEMPEDEIQPAPLPEPSEIAEYLKAGALVDILGRNLGGKSEPTAWITRKRGGELEHTFAADYGMIGGAAIPFWALQQGKIFAPKVGVVLEYLESYGLNREQALNVVNAVGTAP